MNRDHFHFGGGASDTMMHPLVLVAMLVAVLLIFTLRRRQAIIPFLLVALLTPTGQEIYFGGAHWLVLRIVVVAGCLRLFKDKLDGRLLPNGWNRLDGFFIAGVLCEGLSPILLFHTMGAVPFQMAFLLQALGGYFILRYLIQDERDIVTAGKTLAWVAFAVGLCMANERFSKVNIFGYLGSESIVPTLRNGLVRAQACFAHPIVAGCFGATTFPFFYWLKKSRNANVPALAGMLGSVSMVFFSASSTPVMAFCGGIGALCLWPLRNSMRGLRWGLVTVVLGLSVVMKAPVWFLIARVNVTGSSDAYDRAMLIDNFVRHFPDWWAIGADSSSWGHDMWDLCNQFVKSGETGGVVALICFFGLFVVSFSKLGKMRRGAIDDKNRQWLSWSLGAVMFAHILAYFGVSYFDQSIVWWYLTLAIVSAATVPVSGKALAEKVKVEAEEFWSGPVRSSELVALGGGWRR
jgi:hypothetical protein